LRGRITIFHGGNAVFFNDNRDLRFGGVADSINQSAAMQEFSLSESVDYQQISEEEKEKFFHLKIDILYFFNI
jgi:hypothetical protein